MAGNIVENEGRCDNFDFQEDGYKQPAHNLNRHHIERQIVTLLIKMNKGILGYTPPGYLGNKKLGNSADDFAIRCLTEAKPFKHVSSAYTSTMQNNHLTLVSYSPELYSSAIQWIRNNGTPDDITREWNKARKRQKIAENPLFYGDGKQICNPVDYEIARAHGTPGSRKAAQKFVGKKAREFIKVNGRKAADIKELLNWVN